MSADYIPDTPMLGKPVCLQCYPDTDTIKEIIDNRPCSQHASVLGNADAAAMSAGVGLAYLSGSGEADSEDNRRWCDLFHRKSRLLKGGS